MGNINKKHLLKAEESGLLSAKLETVESANDESLESANYESVESSNYESVESANYESMEGANHENVFDAEDYFKIFPDELVLNIFKFLQNYEVLFSCCSHVCKRWNRISSDNSLWKNIFLSKKTLTFDELRKILTFGVRQLHLECCSIKESKDQLFKKVQNFINFNDLQCIYLFKVDMSIDSLINLFSNCCRLTKLDIFYQEINDAVCECIARNKNLITLDLFVHLGDVTALGMSEIFRKCINIHSLTLFILPFSEEDFTFMFHNIIFSPNMECMCIFNNNIRDKHIQKITERFPNLIKLQLGNCINITSSSIKFIVNGLPNLKQLSIRYNDFILPETFLQLRSLHNFVELEICLQHQQSSFLNEIKGKLEKALINVIVSRL